MKQRTNWVAGALILVMALLASVTVAATPTVDDKTTFTKIEGVVKDLETGKVLKNVLVRVEGCKNAAMTNDSGKFFLNEVPVGTCCMKVSKRGYQDLKTDIEVTGEGKNKLTVQLQAEKKAEVQPSAGVTQKG